MQLRADARAVEQAAQHLAMIQPDREIGEPEAFSTSETAAQTSASTTGGGRSDRVHVALVELAEAPLLRPVGAPHRLNLVALEELRQLALVLGDDARQRHGEVVPQREVGFARLTAFLAALQDLENQPIAFFAVLAEQRLDVLDRRRLERLEPVPLIHVGDDADDVRAPAHVLGKKVAHPASGRVGGHVHK